MATRGRRTKRTPEVEKRILDALRVGATQKDACAAAGISDQTFLNWTRDSVDFLDAVMRAEAACAAVMAATIYEAAIKQKDWRAAESWLKRRRKDEWSERQEMTGSGGGALRIEIAYADNTTDDPQAAS